MPATARLYPELEPSTASHERGLTCVEGRRERRESRGNVSSPMSGNRIRLWAVAWFNISTAEGPEKAPGRENLLAFSLHNVV